MKDRIKLLLGLVVVLGLSQVVANTLPVLLADKSPSLKFSQINKIVLLDENIEGYQDLITDIQSSSSSNNIQIIRLNTKNKPLDRISKVLKNYKHLDAIHLFSHGVSGGIKLGNQLINENSIRQNHHTVATWGESLNDNGKILLYGCNVSKGLQGKQFIKTLAEVTHADVIASNNNSGIPQKNQDWVLEDSTGDTKFASLIKNKRDNKFTSSLEFVNGNAFLNANNVVAGIGPDGAFGSNVPAPSGIFQGSRIGYLSDPSRKNFTENFDGDFFLPGFPEEGWAISINGKNYNNNSNIQVIGINGALSNYQERTRYTAVDWKGVVDQLEIKQVYRTYNKGLAIIMDVELKNVSGAIMKNIYYMRTVDPDNNVENLINPTQTFETKNTILKQGGESSGAAVSATQLDGSVVTLSGYTKRARVTYGLLQVRNPIDVYNGRGGLNSTGSKTEDTSISLSVKFEQLFPGEVVRFTLSYALADLVFPSIKLDDDDSSGLSNGSFKQVYLLGTSGKKITDDDVTITGPTTTTLEGLKVKITNPSEGDHLEVTAILPAGMSVDNDEVNDDFEINLKGSVAAEKYIEVLESITFDNQKLDANLATREVIVQILDEDFILSDSADASVFITVPLFIKENIAGDNLLNSTELAQNLLISGTTAPNSKLILLLTDSLGNTVSSELSVEETRIWEYSIDTTKLETLEEGTITVDATSTDSFGNVTVANAVFVKDTKVFVNVTKPIDQSVVTGDTTILEGKSDALADIVIIMPNGDEFITTTEADGNWSKIINNPVQDFNTVISISVKATDPAKNTSTTSLSLKTSPHPVAFTSLDADANNIAYSTRPKITGTSLPGTDITVTITTNSGDRKCSTETGGLGQWVCQMPSVETGGVYPVRVDSKASNGAIAMADETITIPEISLVIIKPINNSTISRDKPRISGRSEPEVEITVSTNDGKTCTATTDSTGDWSCNLPSLDIGESYRITIIARDEVNNEVTDTIDITVSNLTLTVLSPLFNSTTDNSTPLITGKTDPKVEIVVLTELGDECRTVADQNGDWSCQLNKMPIGGPYNLTIMAKNIENNTETSIPWLLSIPDIPLLVLNPIENEMVTLPVVNVVGTTNPNAEVKVTGPDGQKCTTTSDDIGAWSCDLTGLMSGDEELMTVTSVKNGKEKKKYRKFNIGIPLAVIVPAENETITKKRVIVSGTTDANSAVNILGPDGSECSTTSDALGAWSCEIEGLLAGAGKLVSITSVTPDGITKTVSRAINIEIDDGEVETILKGGGSPTPSLLFFILLLLLQKAVTRKQYSAKN